MSGRIHRFTVGSFRCVVLSDGTGVFPGRPAEVFFAHGPQDEVERALREHGLSTETVPNQINALLVDTGAHRILVDGGIGKNAMPGMGALPDSLHEAGLSPDDIDVVVISHGHFDHIGGLIDADGAPVFRRARHVMAAAEWAFWSGESDHGAVSEEQRAAVHSRLLPLKDRLDLITGEADVVPGVRAIPAPGHTPGHLAITVNAGDARLLHMVDALLSPLHYLHPDWSSAFDAQPEQAAATRGALATRAAAEKALVLHYHFPFPSLGHVAETDEGWQWRPLNA